MVNENYTNENYEEDLKLVNYVFNTYFKTYKNIKEDLIADGMLIAWKSRQTFNNKFRYTTYCCHNVYMKMLEMITKNKFCLDTDILLSEKIKQDNSKITLADILEDTSTNFDYIDTKITLEKAIKEYLKMLAQPNIKYKITRLLLKGYTGVEIAKKINCTKSYVVKIKQEFKYKFPKFLKEQGII